MWGSLKGHFMKIAISHLKLELSPRSFFRDLTKNRPIEKSINISLFSIVMYILCLKVNFSTRYLEILLWLDFFRKMRTIYP
jgi:hypothetical protein